MAVERVPGSSSLIDVLDRVLDKGIVVDAWVRISLVGIDVLSDRARVVVTSNNTDLTYNGSFAEAPVAARGGAAEGVHHEGRRQAGARVARRRR